MWGDSAGGVGGVVGCAGHGSRGAGEQGSGGAGERGVAVSVHVGGSQAGERGSESPATG